MPASKRRAAVPGTEGKTPPAGPQGGGRHPGPGRARPKRPPEGDRVPGREGDGTTAAADGSRRRRSDASLQGVLIMFLGAAIVWQADAIGAWLGTEPKFAAVAGVVISASGLVVQRRGRR